MKTSVLITAIIAIILLEAWALYLGYNGILLTTVLVIIAGLAGLVIQTPKMLKGGK